MLRVWAARPAGQSGCHPHRRCPGRRLPLRRRLLGRLSRRQARSPPARKRPRLPKRPPARRRPRGRGCLRGQPRVRRLRNPRLFRLRQLPPQSPRPPGPRPRRARSRNLPAVPNRLPAHEAPNQRPPALGLPRQSPLRRQYRARRVPANLPPRPSLLLPSTSGPRLSGLSSFSGRGRQSRLTKTKPLPC